MKLLDAERVSAWEVAVGEAVILAAVIVVLAGLVGWALARAVHVAAAVRARRGRVSGGRPQDDADLKKGRV